MTRDASEGYRLTYSNRRSALFVVPPYVEDEGSASSPGATTGNLYSFRPLVIQDPYRALVDRLTLAGSRLFDEEAERRRDQRDLSFPGELSVLASVAKLGVNAAWTNEAVLNARAAWAANVALPDGLHRPCCDLSSFSDWPGWAFCDAVEADIRPIAGIDVASISKAMAAARPSDFPMLDSFVGKVLDGFDRTLATYVPGSWPLGVWLARFQILLRAQLPSLAGIESPDGFSYSPVEKLDRLIWLGWRGLETYLLSTWTRVTGIPASALSGFLSGVPAARQADVQAELRVWLPPADPSGGPDLAPGVVPYNQLSAGQQARVTQVLSRASMLAQRYRYVP